MSDGTQKPYRTEMGMVQAFTRNGVKQPAVKINQYNGQNVYEFTIKSLLTKKADGGDVYFDVTMWSGDFGDVAAGVGEGFFVVVDGPFEQKAGQNPGQFFNKITASRISITPSVTKLPRQNVQQAAPAQVVQQPAAVVDAQMQAQTVQAEQPAAVATAPAANQYTF